VICSIEPLPIWREKPHTVFGLRLMKYWTTAVDGSSVPSFLKRLMLLFPCASVEASTMLSSMSDVPPARKRIVLGLVLSTPCRMVWSVH